MTKIIPSNRVYVMAAGGILAALLSFDGAAQGPQVQDARQARFREQARLTQLVPLPELVLLPEAVPFPLLVPLATDPAPAPPPVQPPDQAMAPPTVQPPDQFPPAERARPSLTPRLPQLTPPSEQTMPLQQTRFVELASPTPPVQPQSPTIDTADFPPPAVGISPRDHPAVGAFFGKAIQVCAAGVAPSACAGGQQAGVLFMNPVLTGDGLIIADDSLTLLLAPYGPHACAHGAWTPTSPTEFTAEYTFITRTFPPQEGTISGLRARWVAQVLDADTLVGWVNAYFLSSSPVTWTPLAADQFPVYPPEALGFVTPPNGFVKDPSTCMTAGCPQVFKFTLKRIRR